jgi:hypothetical protein
LTMPAGHKNFVLRGGSDDEHFPSREISLKQVRAVSRIAWEKWGHMVADHPPRDLIALAYVEGLYHGAMIVDRDKISLTGTMVGSASSAAASAALSAPTETETLSVRDLLESL